MAPLCGEMRANFRSQKQDALLNVTNSSRKMSKTVFLEPRDIGHDRWTLATLRFALGRASADRVATTTQNEKIRGVCPSRFVHARRPVQWPRQMGFSHISVRPAELDGLVGGGAGRLLLISKHVSINKNDSTNCNNTTNNMK